MPAEAVDLVSRLLQYSPKLRSTAVSVTSLLSKKEALAFTVLLLVFFFFHCFKYYLAQFTFLTVITISYKHFTKNRKSWLLSFTLRVGYSLQLEALIHPFFDELRDPNTRLLNGRFLPPLFNFKPHGKPVILTLLVLIKNLKTTQ